MTLEEKLRGRDFEQIPLRVTSGVLLHIGAGIYNSLAGALKELVSNAFDAEATRVIISTNYPKFSQIKVLDNGLGMTPGYFIKAMQSIGSTLKGIVHEKRTTRALKRPIIGHLGIGLMALTQVCDEATIESQCPNSDTKFVAKLDFSEFKKRKQKQMEAAKMDIFRDLVLRYGGIKEMKKRLKGLDPESEKYIKLLSQLELATEAEKVSSKKKIKDMEDEHLGYCVLYPDLPAVKDEQGTTITLTLIDKGVQALLKDSERTKDAMPQHYKSRDIDWGVYRDEVNSWSWEELCRRLQLKTSGLSYESLPRYHQFIWELSIMAPIPYFKKGPVTVQPTVLREKRRELTRFNFSMLVDNRQLFKPIILPSGAVAGEDELELEYDYHLESFGEERTVDRERLKYEGYIFWQRKQVQPSKVRGIQIYIRNVGIGLHDQTLVGFSEVNPTSRAGQMSGEIYVQEGLERALNVDRNSFRETDAHYIALQDHIWQLLGSTTRGHGVMGRSVDAYWKRKKRREQGAFKEHVRNLDAWVKRASEGQFAMKLSNKVDPKPYTVKANEIIVYDRSPRWPRSNAQRRLYQQLLVPVKAAIAAGGSAEQVSALLEDMFLRK